jgi:hypothetical protein
VKISSPTNKFDEFVRVVFHSPAAAAGFLTEYPNILKAKDSIGETPLHYLVVENAMNSVRCLSAILMVKNLSIQEQSSKPKNHQII